MTVIAPGLPALTPGTAEVPDWVEAAIELLRPLHEAVLRDEQPSPNTDQLDAASRLAVEVFQGRLDARVTDPVVAGVLSCGAAVFNQALLRLSLKKAPLQHMLARVLDRRWNVPIGTAAVSLNPRTDRVTLWLNPFFLLALQAEQATFPIGHEARHLLHGHLLVDKDLARDEVFTLASEILINARMKRDLGMPMPQIDGETTGIDPDKEYERYRNAAKRASLTPVSKDQFLMSDVDCYKALSSLPKPKPPKHGGCGHIDMPQDEGDQGGSDSGSGGSGSKPGKDKGQSQPGESGGGSQDQSRTGGAGNGLYDKPEFGGGTGGLTSEEVSELVEEVLHQAVKEALAGNEDLKNELLGLGEEFADSKVWGSVGLGRLRGEQPVTTLASYWEQYLHRSLSSRLAPSDRLEYNKKIGWWYPFFTPTGRDQEWEVAVFFDASGSISGPLVERMTALMGVVPNARVTWHSFDTQIYDLGVTEDGRGDVKPIQGGGGTSFTPIYDKVSELEDEPDVVIVVTDGYAEHAVPADPSRYLWLVTTGGDRWMADHGMEMITVDETFTRTTDR